MRFMSGATLISCCYCGAQDIFKIHKGKRRQLACLSCGAPMRKMSPVKVAEAVTKPAPAPKPTPTPASNDAYRSKYEKYKSKYEKSKRHAAYHKKRKKKKGWVAELWDDLDDIFDIDDWFD